MSLARAIIRGRALKERFAVNGSHHASRSLGAERSLVAREAWAVMAIPERGRVPGSLAAVPWRRKRTFAERRLHGPHWPCPLHRHGASLVAGGVQGLRDLEALGVRGDVHAPMIEVDLDRRAGIEALHGLGHGIDAALAGHALDLHQQILAGFFHRGGPYLRSGRISAPGQ